MGKFQEPEDVHEGTTKDLMHSFVVHVKLLAACVIAPCEGRARNVLVNSVGASRSPEIIIT